jgi:hypothetical protein
MGRILVTVGRDERNLKRNGTMFVHTQIVPAEAGTQFLRQSLGPRFRGGERSFRQWLNLNKRHIRQKTLFS